MTTHGHLERDSGWMPRAPEAAALLAALTISVLVSLVAIRWNDTPDTRFGFIVWWALLSASATAVVVALDRVSRRLAPASALSGFAITFFDPGPNRGATGAPPLIEPESETETRGDPKPSNRPESGTPGPDEGERWAARPWMARTLKTVALLAPLAISVLVSMAISRHIEPPSSRVALLAWWVLLSAVATVIVVVVERVSRRLLPLSTLFGLSLVFPDRAPSRYRTALRTGTVVQLKRRIESARTDGLGDDAGEAARTLVELAAALSVHDRLTRGHSERVRAYTKLIAEELDLSADEIDRLQWAGLAHDVGKLFVPAEILNKPGALTDEEYEIVKGHADAGAQLVEPLRAWLGDAIDGVRDHHEWWDGGGYPRGLAGTDISQAGRIVAVADVFDVITSVRSYKKASAVSAARKELVRCSGTQFEPRMVRAFLNVGIGRMRLLVGPLSWLAQLPVAAQIPLGAAVGPAAASAGAAVALAVGGIIGPPPDPAPPTAAAEVPVAPPEVEIAARTPTTAAPVVPPPPDVPPPADPPESPPPPTSAPAPAPIVPVLPPSAADDTTTTREDTPVRVDVVANDTSPGGALRLESVGTTPLGTSVIDGNSIVFTPAADVSGTASIPYVVVDDFGRRATATLTVEITPVNDPPVARYDFDTILEDSPKVTLDVLANDTDVDGGALTISAVSGATRGVATTNGRTISYTPDPDAVGLDVLTYRIDDGRGGTATSTLRITISPVNDLPAFRRGSNQIVLEDAGPQSTPNWATELSGGPADEPQAVTFTVTATDPSLFSTQPAISPAGTLTYTPAADANGSTTVTVTATDTAGATSPAQTSTITITAINDAPSFRAGLDQTVDEDAGPQTTSWATQISGGPADEPQAVTFTVTATDPSLFSTQPALSPAGTLTYTPAADANGSTVFTVTATDTATATSPAQTFTITITAVNDAPSFRAGLDQTIDEDAGPQSTPWATQISGGPADEPQAVTFTVTATDPSLFSTQPAISPAGTLTYTPAADANGSTTVTVTATDTAGATSPAQTSTITITAVNDAPSFRAGLDQTVDEDAGPQSTPWATQISGGPADEPQAVTFTVTATDPSLFSAQPAISPAGTLTYTPAPDANGSTTVTVTATDTAGATSPAQAFTITITAVNDDPVAVAEAFRTNQGVNLVIAAPGLLANDSDPDSDPMWISTSPFSGPANGTLVLGDDGSFTYTPSALFVGVDRFTYELTDRQGGTATAEVTIFVDSALTPAGLFLGTSGTSASTWNLVTTPLLTTGAERDHDGDGAGGLTVRDSDQKLSQTDPRQFQNWNYAPATPLSLKGPVTLDLWSSVANWLPDEDMDYSAWLSDCAIDGTDCRVLTSAVDVHIDDWNRGVRDWVFRSLPVGSVDHVVFPGRMLQLRLMFDHEDAWIAASGDRPSRLDITLGNATPVAVLDRFTVLEDSGTTPLDVLANDIDTDLDPASVRVVSGPFKGAAAGRPDGRIDYAPALNATGLDSLLYEVCDTARVCARALVFVTITPVNDPPAFVAGLPATAVQAAGLQRVNGWASGMVVGPADEAGQLFSFDVTNDDPSLFLIQPNIDASGRLEFEARTVDHGQATVTVVMRDTGGVENGGIDAGAPVTFTITITPLPGAPTANPDPATTTVSTPVDIDVLLNDVDPDGAVLSIVSFTQPAVGSVATAGPGQLRYTPPAGFTGTTTFTYVITDGVGGFDSTTVTVRVNP